MDQFEGLEHHPASLHKYLYAANDPIDKVDPTGRFTTVQMIGVGAIIGVLAANAAYRPVGVVDTLKVSLGGAIAGAAAGAVMAWWAGAGAFALAGAASGAGTLPIIEAQLLRLPQSGVDRIWLGHYGGNGIILAGQRIPVLREAGLTWLRMGVSQFGGKVLSDLPRDFQLIKGEIDAARHIVFNISNLQPGSLTLMEFNYIMSRADLVQKTTFVINATF